MIITGTEVITTTDKVKRDQMFEDLRRNSDECERQVVKFSGSEPYDVVETNVNGTGVVQRYRSTWSIAYPKGPLIRGRARQAKKSLFAIPTSLNLKEGQ